MRVVNVCRTEGGAFVPVEVGDACPICGEVIDHLLATVVPPGPLSRRGQLLHPVAECPNGHLLEREELAG